MTYEELLKVVDEEKIELFENNYIGKLDGLYLDNTITIKTNLKTDAEKKSVLAEELGHYYTSYGNILDQTKLENIKQEKRDLEGIDTKEKIIDYLNLTTGVKGKIVDIEVI